MRFGLVGTGWWARSTPGPALARSGDVDLVGVWGRDATKAGDLAASLGCASRADLDGLLSEVEAVAFAVPPGVQAPLAVHAASLGKHLLMEKPLGESLDEADRVLDAVEAAGVASVVFHTDLYRPELDATWTTLADGRWQGAQATIFAPVLAPGSELLASTWRVEKGALWDAGPHAVSPLLRSLGPVVEVVAMAGPGHLVHAVLRHASGALSTVGVTLEAPARARRWELSWWGPEGWHDRPPVTTSSADAYLGAIADLVRAAPGGGTTRSPASHGREVVAVIDAIQAAIDDPGRAQPVRARQ